MITVACVVASRLPLVPIRMAVRKRLLGPFHTEPEIESGREIAGGAGQLAARHRVDGLLVQFEEFAKRLGVAVAPRCAGEESR